MVVSSSSSAPLVAVVGATGNQGGSVIRALAESQKEYRIRGFTRDVTKPAAQKLKEQGVEPYALEVSVGKESETAKAVEGASYVFAVTNFWAHMSKEKEVAEGKLIVDAVKKVGATLLWSGLENVTEISGGKYTHVDHFDGKAEVAEYARKTGVPTIVVQPGYYASNLVTPSFGPQPLGGGAYGWFSVYNEDTVLPITDIESDYGLFVQSAIEQHKPGDELLAYSEAITAGDLVKQWAEGTGKQINFIHISDQQLIDALKQNGTPDSIIPEIAEMLFAQRDFGYYGKKDLKPSHANLPRPTKTFADFVKRADWSSSFK